MKRTVGMFSLGARALILQALILASMLPVTTPAQDAAKPKVDAPKQGSTADAWRQALPQNEEVAPTPGAAGAANAARSGADNRDEAARAEVERIVTGLEESWMAAVKTRDGVTLKQLLSAEFTFNGARATEGFIGKPQFVAHSLEDWRLSSYGFEQVRVRVYANTAIVNGVYRQQATAAGEEWSGNFLFTDVWVNRSGTWKVVSRHLSRLNTEAEKK